MSNLHMIYAKDHFEKIFLHVYVKGGGHDTRHTTFNVIKHYN